MTVPISNEGYVTLQLTLENWLKAVDCAIGETVCTSAKQKAMINI